MAQGELAIVLHTHMPYVESGGPWPHPDNPPHGYDWAGLGTWPFGEEWLWEAIATCYVPLLGVLDDAAARWGEAPLTVSLTPVLADQLERSDAIGRCRRFLSEVRAASHRLDIAELRGAGEGATAVALEHSAGQYAAAAAQLDGGLDLLGGLTRHASWTSTATHAVLPLVATDAGVTLQLETGLASHRRRCGRWSGGLWLPECGWAPWLGPLLAAAGVRAACVELTRHFGLGDGRHLRPLATPDGLTLWPIDRATIALVWGAGGYPSRAPYRDTHRLTTHRHQAWRVDGAPYDGDEALAQAAADARDFVTRVRARVSGGGVCVCALDTELLGVWWHEGVAWLRAVLDEADRQGLALARLDNSLGRWGAGVGGDGDAVSAVSAVSSWGTGEDLRTWSGPAVAELAWQARAVELTVAAHGASVPPRALRELLALQSSDWAFAVDRASAGDYPAARAAGHAAAARQALADPGALTPELRGLAPDLAGWP